jgi:hypothetical protein
VPEPLVMLIDPALVVMELVAATEVGVMLPNDSVMVPELVIGEPLTPIPEPPDTATEVTDPEPAMENWAKLSAVVPTVIGSGVVSTQPAPA